MTTAISPDLRRFLLGGSLSVPHVEAILQLRHGGSTSWNAERLAARLYVGSERAASLLSELSAAGVVTEAQTEHASTYAYNPQSPELTLLLDELEKAYAEHLVAITHLIHTAEERKALNFADAFRFRKE